MLAQSVYQSNGVMHTEATQRVAQTGRTRIIPLIGLLTGVPILATAILQVRTSSTFFQLTRDPSAATGTSPYFGFLSQVSLFFWVSAVAIGLFSSHLLAERAKPAERAKRHWPSQFLQLAGLFTLLLAIDDAFLLHDFFLPKVLGVSEKPILAAYGAALGWLLVRYRAIIRSSRWRILMAALLAFGASLVIDHCQHPSEIRILFEDGFKLLGIVCWMTYLVDVASRAINAMINQQSSAGTGEYPTSAGPSSPPPGSPPPVDC